ncbi:MAG: DNA topoisomerase IB [Bacteroidales bacterium]|nr:DNA topoisomerase IB [Bacteroidales bacterium]
MLKRKQYRYHPAWNIIRKKTKFYRLYEFGKQIPTIRTTIELHLSLPGYPKEKILAAAISILEQTSIRVGNSFYEKLYGSFGLTTLKNRHITLTGSQLRFTFKGKKNIRHNITLKSKKLARIIKACIEIPGKELFEFYDTDGNIHGINSGMVNRYIREISNGYFTAKDFRTWSGTVTALNAFLESGDFETSTEMNQKIATVFDVVAKQLGNTPNVCKNYYVHPVIVDIYKKKKMDKYLDILKTLKSNDDDKMLMPVEKLLMKILEKN